MPATLVYGQDLPSLPGCGDGMLRDRGVQFRERLGWDLDTDREGRETDRYDALNPLYVIETDDSGRHVGSARVLPTTGPTMIADHFSHLTDGVAISSPKVWEVTRFFVTERANRRTTPSIMWAGCDLALRSGVGFFASVTGAQLIRVFRSFGWPLEVLGRADSPEGEICACLWEVTPELCEKLRRRAGAPKGARAEIWRPSQPDKQPAVAA